MSARRAGFHSEGQLIAFDAAIAWQPLGFLGRDEMQGNFVAAQAGMTLTLR